MGWWHRFLVPQVPLLALLAGCSLQAWPTPTSRAASRVRAAGFALLILLPLLQVPMLLHWLPSHHQHELRYRELGRRLRPFAAPDRWLVYHDVGSLVYEAEWNTIDVVGLNTRRSELRVFARSDVGYARALRAALLDGWPASYTRQPDALTWYWRTFKTLFFQ